MKIDIDAAQFVVTKRMKDHLQRRLSFALGGLEQRVRKVVVRLFPPAPEKNEPHTRCEIEVALRPVNVRAEDADVDPYLAIDKAADRLGRTVSRALSHEKAWPGTTAASNGINEAASSPSSRRPAKKDP